MIEFMFSWNNKKRLENLETRKVDFAEVIDIFDDQEIIESIDGRYDYGEERIQALGKIGNSFYLVAYTWRGNTRHIITAWEVGENGRKRYTALFARRHRGDEGKR